MIDLEEMISLEAKPVREQSFEETRTRTQAFLKAQGRPPKLAVVLVGEDPASVIYTTRKGEAAVQVGMAHETIRFPASATPREVLSKITALNRDPKVDGILIQRPLPPQFDEKEVLLWVDPSKDVDAFHPLNAGMLYLGLPTFLPCTPAGIMRLLKHYKISPDGKLACVVGRSSIVGKPMQTLLLQANATVIQCHSKTKDLASFTTQADLLIVAAGKPHLIGAKEIKKGATVIDVGIHRDKAGKIQGDVDTQSAAKVAGALTPVPGGVGPMTIAMLLENTLLACELKMAK